MHACIIIIRIISQDETAILFNCGKSSKTLIANTKEKEDQKYRKQL